MDDPEEQATEAGARETEPLLSNASPQPTVAERLSALSETLREHASVASAAIRGHSSTFATAAGERASSAYAATSTHVSSAATQARDYFGRVSSSVTAAYQGWTAQLETLFPDTPENQSHSGRALRIALALGMIIFMIFFAGAIKVAVSPPATEPGPIIPSPSPNPTSDPHPPPSTSPNPEPSLPPVPVPTDLPPVPVPNPPPEPNTPCTTSACIIAASRLIKSIDASVNPCNDFYHFVCGGWEKANRIPEYALSQSIKQELKELNLQTIESILSGKAKLEVASENDLEALRGVRQFHANCLKNDHTSSHLTHALVHTLRKNVIQPAFPLYRSTFPDGKRVTLKKSVATALSALHELDVPAIFHVHIDSSPYEDDKNEVFIGHGRGLLPYKLLQRNGIVEHYEDTIASVMRSAVDYFRQPGFGRSWKKIAKEIVAVERALAWAMSTGSTSNSTPYFRVPLKKLEDVAPAVPWRSYLEQRLKHINVTVTHSTVVNVAGVKYYTALSSIFERTDPLVLEDFLLWQVIKSYAEYAGDDVKIPLERLRAVIAGVRLPATKPTWKICAESVQKNFGTTVGKWFVNATLTEIGIPYISAEDKKQYLERMEFYFKDAFRNQIWHNDWMDFDTASAAADKVCSIQFAMCVQQDVEQWFFKLWTMSFHVGLPPPYSTTDLSSSTILTSGEKSYFDTIVGARAWRVQVNLKTLGNVLSRGRWIGDSGEIKVKTELLTNSVSVSSGILRSPIFDVHAPAYLSFGALGSRLGSEMLRAFDGEGRFFDGKGLLHQWYTPETLAAHQNITQCYVNKFNATEEAVMRVLLDVGGLDAALEAWQWDREAEGGGKRNGKLYGVPDVGVTEESGVYLGYGTSMCAKWRTKRGKHVIADHVNRVASLSSRFAGAFGCNVATDGLWATREGWDRDSCPALW
ncbi:Endothelin-converting enzyme 2 [Rhizophlyctis rosea]|nr:Endothelin-converting enzyme 2 [Rhizophlyctis rosea]